MSSGVEFDNRLIELVRCNPSLYECDSRMTPYDRNKNKKMELWRSIAASLKTDVSTCITRWNFFKDKLRREMLKEHSEWTWMRKLQFLVQHEYSSSHHNNERQQQKAVISTTPTNANWRALSTDALIEHDEDDALQEAMDEQHSSAVVLQPPPPPAQPSATTSPSPSSSEDVMKRIDALLQGLGANRTKAEKKILAYLCKCNLRALNDEQIDDIFI